MLRSWRKPLVVMTPKSLLRDPRAVSPLQECAAGKFQRVLADPIEPKNIRRVLLCTGKIYYELLQQREAVKREDVAIIRLEQLYPFPDAALQAALCALCQRHAGLMGTGGTGKYGGLEIPAGAFRRKFVWHPFLWRNPPTGLAQPGDRIRAHP